MKTVLCENKKEKSGTNSNRFKWWQYLMQNSPCFKNQHRTTHTFLKDAKVTSQHQKQFYNSKPGSYLLYKISIFKIKLYIFIWIFHFGFSSQILLTICIQISPTVPYKCLIRRFLTTLYLRKPQKANRHSVKDNPLSTFFTKIYCI